MKLSLRFVPLVLGVIFTIFVLFSMQQYSFCREILGIDEYRCVSKYLGLFDYSVFYFAVYTLLTGLFLTGIRIALTRAWLVPALIYSLFSLFLIIFIGPEKNLEYAYARWSGMIFYFGTIAVMLLATVVARAREGKPIIAMDGIAKLLLLVPLTYFVLLLTVFGFPGNNLYF